MLIVILQKITMKYRRYMQKPSLANELLYLEFRHQFKAVFITKTNGHFFFINEC